LFVASFPGNMPDPQASTQRRTVIAGLGSLAGFGALAGCATGDSDGDDGAAGTDTVTTEHDGESSDEHDGDHHGGDGEGPDAPDLEPLRETLTEEVTVPEGAVTLGVGFVEGHLPVSTAVYEPTADAEVRDTGQYDSSDLADVDLAAQPPERLPVVSTDDLDFYRADVDPGETRRLALVVESERDATFESSPPHGEPFGHGSGLSFTCYCTDEVYEVDADGLWARVVEIRVGPGIDPGTVGVLAYPVSGDGE
jgi:hypothetical protein